MMRYRVTQEFQDSFRALNAVEQRYAYVRLAQFADAEKFVRQDMQVTRSSADVWAVAFGNHSCFTYSFVIDPATQEMHCVLRTIGSRIK